MPILVWLGLIAGVVLGATAPAVAQDAPPLAIVGATVVPMDRPGALPDQTVLVSGERIVAVGPAAEVKVPAGATVVDGHGRWLMPGLVDMHVHAWFESELTLFLANGVTTIRNMFGSPLQVAWRDEIAAGTRLGPTIVTAGPIVDGSPPVWPGSLVVETPEQAADAVRQHVEGHYDFVKVYERLQPEAYAAVMQAAKEAGLPVFGHVPQRVGLRGVLPSGQRTMEHLFGFEGCFADAPPPEPPSFLQRLQSWASVEPERLNALAAEAAAAGVYQCPTLVVMQKMGVGSAIEGELARPCMRYAPPFSLGIWKQSATRGGPELAVAARDGERSRLALVGALRDAGAPLLLGTDCGNAWVLAGFSIHEELANLVAAGLSPAEALRAGTLTPAECLGTTGEVGAVAPGLRADLLLLDADPLADVAHVQRRAGLVVRGRWLPESELQARLAALVTPTAAVEPAIEEPAATPK